MDIRDLHYFEVICETGNLVAAAQQVHRTQPALSKCIARLEAESGARLFEREGRRLKLTAVGEVLQGRARVLNAAMKDIVGELHQLSTGVKGHVRIGYTASATARLLPAALSALREHLPVVSTELIMGLNDELRASLRAGRVDMILGPLLDGDAEFHSHALYDDEVVIAACKTHPVFGAARPHLETLAHHGWVLPPRTASTRVWLEALFQRRRLPEPRVQIESGSMSLMPQLLDGTDLLTFTSRDHVDQARPAGFLRRVVIPGTLLRRRMGLLHRSGYLSPAALSLVRAMRSSGEPVRSR